MDVEAVLKARDANASATFRRVGEAAGRAQSQFERLNVATERVGMGFEGVKGRLEALAATVGIGFGIHEIWESFVGLNAETETATRSLGGMLSGLYKFDHAKGVDNLVKGIARSHEMMEGFQKTALQTGIPVAMMAQTARELAPGFARARASTAQLGQATKQVAMLTKLIGGDTQQSAMAMSSFLQYGMAMRSPLLMQLGLHGRIYAQMTAQQRLALLMKKIKAFGVTPEALQQVQTYDDLIGRVKAEFGYIQETAGKPLFEAAKKEAAKLADWLSKNEGTLERIGSVVADKFVGGLEKAVTVATYLSKHMDAVKNTVEAMLALWTGKKAIDAINNALSLANAIAKGGGGGGEAGGLSVGGLLGKGGSLLGRFLGTGAGAAAGVGAAVGGSLYALSAVMAAERPKISKEVQAAEIRRQMVEQREVSRAKELLGTYGKKGMASSALDSLITNLSGGHNLGYFRMAARELGFQGAPALPVPKTEGLERPKGGDNNFYNSRFDITQQFAPGFDPDRVAAAFTSDLALLADQPRQAHAGRGVPFQRT